MQLSALPVGSSQQLLTQSWQNRFGDLPVENTNKLSCAKLMLHRRLNICKRSWVGSSFCTCRCQHPASVQRSSLDKHQRWLHGLPTHHCQMLSDRNIKVPTSRCISPDAFYYGLDRQRKVYLPSYGPGRRRVRNVGADTPEVQAAHFQQP